MINRTNISAILIVCSSFVLLYAGISNSAYAGQKDKEHEQQVTPSRITGKVTDVIDASGYTYAEVNTGKEKVWAAGPVTALKIGDMIAFTTGMPMKNFHSKSMDRDFPIVYFTDSFITDKGSATTRAEDAPSPHGQMQQQPVVESVKDIKKVEGGNTVAEILADKDKLNGKTVHVRGKVTKFNSEIMGKNWLHIRDSSSLDDLTVTTNSTVAIGDVVILEGKLGLDKDYGYGYIYPVILEDAQITKE